MGTATTASRVQLTPPERTRYEQIWAGQMARENLNPQDLLLWEQCRQVIRPHAYYNKIYVVWSLQGGAPVVRDVLAVVEASLALQTGIHIHLASRETRDNYVITASPSRIGNFEIFAWVPYFNEVRFAGRDYSKPGGRNVRTTLCFKTFAPVGAPPVEGQDYISELHVFRKDWPAHADTRF